MISKNDCLKAITKCSGYDPAHAPEYGAMITNAWIEHFAAYPSLTNEDLLSAVAEYYRNPGRSWPQPADISSIARARRHDEADRAPLPALTSAPATAAQREQHMSTIRQILSRQGKRWSLS